MSGKIAVMGAGAVGCWYGGQLALAGENVVLIGRPALAKVLATRGLRLEQAGQSQEIALQASSDAAAVAGADLVLFCVKSGDTTAAGRQIAPYLSPDAVVLSLQNGISNAAELEAILGRPVIPVVVYVAVDLPEPGLVRHHGGGKLILAAGPGATATTARLQAAGLQAEVSDAAQTAAWTKFTVNCCLNAISALTGQNYSTIAAAENALALMQDVLSECRAVASASGITLPDTIWQSVLDITTTMPKQLSSTAQDLQRGRSSEIDHLNGEIVRRAKSLGLATPANNALWALIKLAETRPPLLHRQDPMTAVENTARPTDASERDQPLKNAAVTITQEDPCGADLSLLFQRHTEAMHADTPPESIHMMDASQLADPQIRFFVMREADGQAIGMGAFKRLTADLAEIKSMHVLAETRGRGLSRRMLAHLEAQARADGLQHLALETGIQPTFIAARALYARDGYVECPPFGSYSLDPNSVFMTKALN